MGSELEGARARLVATLQYADFALFAHTLTVFASGGAFPTNNSSHGSHHPHGRSTTERHLSSSWQLSRKANASPEGKFQLLNLYQMEGEL